MTKTSKQTWPLPAVDVNRLVRRFCRMLKSDAARLTSPLGKTIFLIIGENRNTKDDEGQWIDQDGKVRNWDYVRESCVASGDTVDELIASAKHYKRLQGMTWEQYFRQPNNHWKTAVETHTRNHPWARHKCLDLASAEADPSKLIPGGKLDILVASPECTHHSIARGGKPCR